MNYLETLAEQIRAEMPNRSTPPDQEPDLFLIYAVLLTSKGEAVTEEDVHDAWTAWMTMRGEEHRSMVPFADLSAPVRAEDAPFVSAIRAVARRARRKHRRLLG